MSDLPYTVQITEKEWLTQDVIRFQLEKPPGLKAKGELDGHRLIFANKTGNDIFLEKELSALLGKNYINILSRHQCDIYYFGHVDQAFLQQQPFKQDQCFYVCGPGGFSASVENALLALGVKQTSIITEY